MPNQDGVELRWIFAVMRRWWWIILGCTVLVTGIVIASLSIRSSVYEATATLLIQPAPDSRSNEYNLLVTGERLALTYSQMLKSQPVMQKVIEQEVLEDTPDQLADRITAVPITDTQLIRLTVSDKSPNQAAFLANAVAQAFTSFIKEINSERYATILNSKQEKMDELDALIQQTQLTMNDYRASMIESEADLVHQESNLNEYRNEYQAIQQDFQDLQLTVSQLKENVSVIEAAHAAESGGGSTYTATVTLFLTNEDLASTYIRILTGQPVLEETIALLGLSESPDELINWLTVNSVIGTHLIQLYFSDVNESQAILVADTLAWVFIDQIQKLVVEPYANNLSSLRTQLDELSTKIERTQLNIESLTLENIQSETELGRLEGLLITNQNDFRTLQQDYEQLRLTASDAAESVFLSEPALIPTNPVQRGRLYTVVAIAVGLMVGVGLAFILEFLDDTIKTPKDISQMLGLDTLGSIPKIIDGEDELVVASQPRSPVAESFRILGTNLRFASLDKSISILLVTSPEPEAGKSVVVANLAVAIAMSGSKVVVVDADLRRPRQHLLFNLKSGEGLTGSLLEGTSDDRVLATKIDGLSILPSGKKLPPNPTELLGSQTMHELLEELSSEADLILVDSPPVLGIADTAALTPSVDGVLFVLESGVARPLPAQQALANLQQVGGNLIGVVLNAVPNQMDPYSYYRESDPSSNGGKGKRQVTQKEFGSSFWRRLQKKVLLPSFRTWFQGKQ